MMLKCIKSPNPGFVVGKIYSTIVGREKIPVVVLTDEGDYYHVAQCDLWTYFEEYKEDYDNVKPDHYKTNDKEVWEYMIEIYGLDKFIAFCELNVFKYSMRVGKKPGASVEDDLGKIRWYAEKIKELRDDQGA